MYNYKQRNYGSRGIIHEDRILTKEDVLYSNMLYDQNKGKTHDFIHTNKGHDDDTVRLISDVEICMSTDPSVASYYPPEYRQSLYNAIKGVGSKSQFAGLSDDEILASGIKCRDLREIDENLSSVQYMYSQLPDHSEFQPQPQPQTQPNIETSKSD